MQISTIEMLGGFVFLSIYLAFSNGFQANWFAISSNDWLYLILLGVFCTAITFPVSVFVMRKLTPFTISISLNLEPIYTILLALVIFGDTEHMSAGFYFGALIIFTTVIANAFIKYRLRKKIIV
jgi:drug/metabolite transporter (DMT)-like permease